MALPSLDGRREVCLEWGSAAAWPAVRLLLAWPPVFPCDWGETMKLAVECAVEAVQLYVGSGLTVGRGDQEYSLVGDADDKLVAVKIVARIPEDEQVVSDMEPGSGDVAVNVRIGLPGVYGRLMSQMQAFEGLLSFRCGGQFARLRWDRPKVEFIPENEGEEADVAVHGFQFSEEYRDHAVRIPDHAWAEIVDASQQLGGLVVPLSFLREALNDFRQFRYVAAFCNFYFILEDFYGAGKTKNRDIEREFKSSPELRESVRWTMDNYLERGDHRAEVQRLCEEERKAYDVDGLIELLVRVRGNLHHFSTQSSKRHGTPFNQEDFKSIAFFAMGLVSRAVAGRLFNSRKTG